MPGVDLLCLGFSRSSAFTDAGAERILDCEYTWICSRAACHDGSINATTTVYLYLQISGSQVTYISSCNAVEAG